MANYRFSAVVLALLWPACSPDSVDPATTSQQATNAIDVPAVHPGNWQVTCELVCDRAADPGPETGGIYQIMCKAVNTQTGQVVTGTPTQLAPVIGFNPDPLAPVIDMPPPVPGGSCVVTTPPVEVPCLGFGAGAWCSGVAIVLCNPTPAQGAEIPSRALCDAVLANIYYVEGNPFPWGQSIPVPAPLEECERQKILAQCAEIYGDKYKPKPQPIPF
jgi:hypothetical protein